jgi:16S rRNA (guanine1207-N2)-methyltransferase
VKFVEAASRSLLPGGMVIIVSKQPQWYRDHLGDWFDSVEVHESRRYHIASGIKPRRPRHPSIGGMARY